MIQYFLEQKKCYMVLCGTFDQQQTQQEIAKLYLLLFIVILLVTVGMNFSKIACQYNIIRCNV